MKKQLILLALLASGSACLAQRESAETGKFEPTWESLSQYKVPEWFRDAKFGIWAHWGPQCEPEAGDWYGKAMYEEGGNAYKRHMELYGHPSEFGFKDVINEWKAENWDPDRLVSLYKRVGAQYFFAMGNHHDNMDLWDSKYQAWNSVNMGPKRDILAEWEKAARKYDLPFGVSIHSSHAWTWWKTQARMTPGAKVDLTPEAKIGLTPLSKIKMTPVDIEPAGDFICIFGFRFGRRGIKPKKHEYKVKKHSPVSRIGNGNKKHQQCF